MTIVFPVRPGSPPSLSFRFRRALAALVTGLAATNALAQELLKPVNPYQGNQTPPAISSGRPGVVPPEKGIDPYGGLAIRVAEPSGFFQVVKLANRWVLATPAGNAFLMKSVYLVTPVGLEFPGKYPSKGDWAEQAVRRLKSWGFNALGEYASGYALPVPTHGNRTANAQMLPFIRMVRPSSHCLDNRFGMARNPVIDLISSVDPMHRIWRGGSFPDVFSPSFEETVEATAKELPKGSWSPIFPPSLSSSPWLIGTSTDDADFLYGFKRSDTAHLGWMVAVASPTRTSGSRPGGKTTFTYTDPRFYTKHAWVEHLKRKYRTVEALNRAWGSTYTTFDSEGGWPAGKGVLDESGRNPWMSPNRDYTGVANRVVLGDLDDMMEAVADRYFTITAKHIREFTPNHLVFGPATLHDSKPPILRAAARHIDVLQVIITPGNLSSMEEFLNRVTASFKKPLFLWTTFTAQKDSPLAASPNRWGEYDEPTQESRGEAYRRYLPKVMAYAGVDGSKPILGVDFWSWADNPGEKTNFGLVTTKDNAYDGKESVRGAGRDRWGFVTGGEASDYGDFLSKVVAANLQADTRLTEELDRLPSGAFKGATKLP